MKIDREVNHTPTYVVKGGNIPRATVRSRVLCTKCTKASMFLTPLLDS